MSITLEIDAADPEEFVSLQKRRASEQTSEEEAELIFNQLSAHPQADFSLHLPWPEDIDALCQAMMAQGEAVPASHTRLLAEELWFDGMSDCVTRLSQALPLALPAVVTVLTPLTAHEGPVFAGAESLLCHSLVF